jgi:hypothetical protein
VSTKADAVCLALAALWQADGDLSTVEVVDGPQANSEAANEWLFVGFDGDAPDEGSEGLNATQDLMAFAKTKQETGEVTNAIVVRDGGTDIPSLRARAFQILSDAEDSLRTDMTLGGTVMQAYVSEHSYMPTQTTAGAKVRVVFTVTYLAQL